MVKQSGKSKVRNVLKSNRMEQFKTLQFVIDGKGRETSKLKDTEEWQLNATYHPYLDPALKNIAVMMEETGIWAIY